MKTKKGYTLAEVLIALGIIGFISAIMLPMINKIKPDPIKVSYLKTYDGLMAATHDIVGNTLAYPLHDDEENPTIKYNKCPLFNTAKVKVNGIEYDGGNAKFCEFLGATFNIIESTPICKNNPITYSDSTFEDNISFTGVNGVQYLVSTDTSNDEYRTDVYIDVNGDDGKNCMYVDGGTCKNPDRFKLSIAANGLIVPQDKVGAKYLEERLDWTKRSVEKADVKNIDDIISSLKPENIGPEYEPYYKNCEGYEISGIKVSCMGFTNPYNTGNGSPFLEMHSNTPLGVDQYFYNYYMLPGGNPLGDQDAVLMCKFPAGATEVTCGSESLYLKDGVEEKLAAMGLTKEDLQIGGLNTISYGHSRIYKYNNDGEVRYLLKSGKEVAASTSANWNTEVDAAIDTIYKDSNYNANTRVSEQSVMSNIKKDLNDWGITQQNAKDLYNYLNGN